MKQFILASGYFTDQVTKEFSSSLYNPPNRGEYILSTETSTLSDHLTNTIVDDSTYGSWLVIIPPSGAESSTRITLAFTLQRRNREQIDSLLDTTTLPNLDQSAPDIGINLPLGVVVLTTSQLSRFNTDLLKFLHNTISL